VRLLRGGLRGNGGLMLKLLGMRMGMGRGND
jgi:hypothetical protein